MDLDSAERAAVVAEDPAEIDCCIAVDSNCHLFPLQIPFLCFFLHVLDQP
jgi:hypothetical protein